MKTYRQGDVLVMRIAKPKLSTLTSVSPKNGKVILALGEATGHHHRIESPHCQEWIDDAGMTVIEARRAVELLHEEHATVPLGRGWYRKIAQMEYAPAEIRRVVD